MYGSAHSSLHITSMITDNNPHSHKFFCWSTAASQLSFNWPWGGFCHWVHRFTGVWLVRLAIVVAWWKATRVSCAHFTKHVGFIIGPPKTTLFLQSHSWWEIIATNSRSSILFQDGQEVTSRDHTFLNAPWTLRLDYNGGRASLNDVSTRFRFHATCRAKRIVHYGAGK